MDIENNKVDILIVDDREDNLTVLEAVLAGGEYKLTRANSGYQAVAAAHGTEFAVILLDVQMPDLDGFETARLIRAQGASKDTPIIFLTAIYAEETYVQLGYDVGAVDYIFKPFNPGVLKSKVGVFAELYRKNRQLLRQSELLHEVERNERARQVAELELKNLQRELALREIERRLTAVVDRAPIALLSVDSKGNINLCEGQGLGAIDINPPEIVGQSAFKMFSQQPSVIRFVRRALSGEDVIGEVEIKGRVFDTFACPEKNTNQQITGIMVIMRDVTEQKMAEREILKSEESQRFLAEAGTHLSTSLDYDLTLNKVANLAVPKFASWCTVHMLDDKGKIKRVAVAHHEPEKAGLIDCLDHLIPKYRHDFVGVNHVIKTGESVFVPDVRFKQEPNDEDARRCLELIEKVGLQSYICVPLRGREGTMGVVTFVSANRKFEERDRALLEELAWRASLAVDNARLYARAEQAIRTRDEFLSIASHELRTPLTPLKIQYQTISRAVRDGKFATLPPETLHKMMTRADRQLDRISNLIESLLNVSRINMGRLTIDRHPTDLNKLIADTTEQFREQLLHAKCDLVLELDENLQGHWDAFKLEQVVVNLLSNAIKYGAGQPIKVWAKDHEDTVRFAVEDYGIGISDEDQKRIFDLFERAVSARNYGGLGLGLYIVRNIIEEHGGTIRVLSAPGQGSKFIVELPKEAVNTAVALANQAAASSSSMSFAAGQMSAEIH